MKTPSTLDRRHEKNVNRPLEDRMSRRSFREAENPAKTPEIPLFPIFPLFPPFKNKIFVARSRDKNLA